MPVIMLLAAAAILAMVVVVACGRGGEMAAERPDYAPPDLGPVAATDVALLRPPTSAWGYNIRATDEALERIAMALSERDIQIAALQQEITNLRESRVANPGVRHPVSGEGAVPGRWHPDYDPLPRRWPGHGPVPGKGPVSRDEGHRPAARQGGQGPLPRDEGQVQPASGEGQGPAAHDEGQGPAVRYEAHGQAGSYEGQGPAAETQRSGSPEVTGVHAPEQPTAGRGPADGARERAVHGHPAARHGDRHTWHGEDPGD